MTGVGAKEGEKGTLEQSQQTRQTSDQCKTFKCLSSHNSMEKKERVQHASKKVTKIHARDLEAGAAGPYLDALVVAVHGAQTGQVGRGSGPGRFLWRGHML